MDVFAKVSLPGEVMPGHKGNTDFLKTKTLLKKLPTFITYQRLSVAGTKQQWTNVMLNIIPRSLEPKTSRVKFLGTHSLSLIPQPV